MDGSRYRLVLGLSARSGLEMGWFLVLRNALETARVSNKMALVGNGVPGFGIGADYGLVSDVAMP